MTQGCRSGPWSVPITVSRHRQPGLSFTEAADPMLVCDSRTHSLTHPLATRFRKIRKALQYEPITFSDEKVEVLFEDAVFLNFLQEVGGHCTLIQ